MTPTGKPGDDHEGERPEPGRPTQTPPPSHWLDDQDSSSGPLLPADDPEDDLEDDAEDEGDAPEDFPEDTPEDDPDADMADRTVMDPNFNQTMVLPKRQKSAAGRPAETAGEGGGDGREAASPVLPAPVAEAPAASTDAPAPPSFPYGQDKAEVTRTEIPLPPPSSYEEDMADVTRIESPGQPPPSYGQDMGDVTRIESPTQPPPSHEQDAEEVTWLQPPPSHGQDAEEVTWLQPPPSHGQDAEEVTWLQPPSQQPPSREQDGEEVTWIQPPDQAPPSHGQDMGDVTRTEFPALPPPSYGQNMADATRIEKLPPIPPQAAHPQAAHPQPAPSQSPPAHEPFPWAQEIPGTPARPAPEPFPYAQEMPGARTPPAQRTPPAAEPFPWAQQVPGTPPPGPEAVHPVAPPPVIEEPWRTGAPRGPKGPRKSIRKPLLIGAGGLAAVALVAAGVLVVPGLIGGGDDDGGGAGAKLAGALFPVDAAARTDGRDQQVTGVAARGSTVVAVGGETDPQSSRGMFLVSADGGRTFRSVDQQGTDGGVAPSGGVPEAVGASRRGWVAVGSRAGGGGAVWTSKDGKEWRRQPDAVGDVFGPHDRVTRIVGTGGGFLAVGENSPKGDFSDARPAVWLSSDGRRWEARVGDQIGLQVQNGELALVEAAANGDVILLEGLITPDSKKPGPYRKVWRSDDAGRTWAASEVPAPKGSRGLMIGGGGGSGFLAMREMSASGKVFGQAFTSKDGRSWTRTGKLEPAGYQRTNGIVADGQGFTAVVVRGTDVLLARSANGAAWKAAGSAESKAGREVLGAAASGGQTVLVGREPGGGDLDPLLGVWDAGGAAVPVDLAKIPGAIRPDHAVRAVAAANGLAVAVGSASGDAAVWSSRDGASWKAAQGLGAAFTRPGPQRLDDVAAGGAGWLAVGYDQSAPRRPLVVTSQDGSTWQAADTAPAFAANKQGAPVTNAAAAGSAGYVVVGTQGYSGAIWYSPDLKNWARGAGADPRMTAGTKTASRWMLDVTSGSFGYAAVGGSRDGKGNHPSVWLSPDGKRWTLQELQLPGAGVTEGHLTHVAAKGNTLVAAGIAATPKGIDWLGYVSTDAGRTWRPLPSPSGGTTVGVTALTATPKGFAATGTTGRAGATDVVSWTSADGSSWQASTPGGTGLGGVGDQEVTGLAALGGTLLGVGRNADSNGVQPVLWSRPVP
ncbi:hypothetical protein BKA00_006481 [Actinomadura coerulea]|uniref:Uncharacterized protein n=1 Tax=Actinomadura coerulea TaxID=46159 RepID=A0A7X0G556_9ACTN|nr:hypothetical protein [Actinomadura coerulea]MBB6399567.1 hypothetical protein [Actinomadura coerulea]